MAVHKNLDEFLKKQAKHILPGKGDTTTYSNVNNKHSHFIGDHIHWVTYACDKESLFKEKLLAYCKKIYGKDYTISISVRSGPGGFGDVLTITVGKVTDLANPRDN